MLSTADRATSGREWAGKEFCVFGGFAVFLNIRLSHSRGERTREGRGTREDKGTQPPPPRHYSAQSPMASSLVSAQPWQGAGAPRLRRLRCWAGLAPGHVVKWHIWVWPAGSGAGPALCSSLLSPFRIVERTVRWELARGGNVGVCWWFELSYSRLSPSLTLHHLKKK